MSSDTLPDLPSLYGEVLDPKAFNEQFLAKHTGIFKSYPLNFDLKFAQQILRTHVNATESNNAGSLAHTLVGAEISVYLDPSTAATAVKLVAVPSGSLQVTSSQLVHHVPPTPLHTLSLSLNLSQSFTHSLTLYLTFPLSPSLSLALTLTRSCPPTVCLEIRLSPCRPAPRHCRACPRHLRLPTMWLLVSAGPATLSSRWPPPLPRTRVTHSLLDLHSFLLSMVDISQCFSLARSFVGCGLKDTSLSNLY